VAAELEIRLLEEADDRSSFSCGQPDLDRFFHHYAGQNQFKLHLAATYVAVLDARIVGFATVSGASVERRNVPTDRMRRRLPSYPLPVVRLARLGVDRQVQGQGVGKALLRHVLMLAVYQRDRLGCIGVITDAKPEAVPFYRSLGFVEQPGVREGSLHGEPAAMFLSMAQVVQALTP
jgi:GNAT superfamily N-acetyltransferase